MRHELPDDVELVTWEGDGAVHLPALLAQAFGISTSEARRHLAQGAVRLDGEVVPAAHRWTCRATRSTGACFRWDAGASRA